MNWSNPKNRCLGIRGLLGNMLGSGAGIDEISTLISTGGSSATIRGFLAGGGSAVRLFSSLLFSILLFSTLLFSILLFFERSGDESSLDGTNSLEVTLVSIFFLRPRGLPGPCFFSFGVFGVFSAFGGFGGLLAFVGVFSEAEGVKKYYQ